MGKWLTYYSCKILHNDMTTGEPEITRQISKTLYSKKINFIDVCKWRSKGANQGNIAIMVGGFESQFAKIKPLMDDISSNIFYSKIGSGHSIKAGNNLLNLICRMATLKLFHYLSKMVLIQKKQLKLFKKAQVETMLLKSHYLTIFFLVKWSKVLVQA